MLSDLEIIWWNKFKIWQNKLKIQKTGKIGRASVLYQDFLFHYWYNVVCLRILNHSNQCCPLLWNIMNSTSNRPLKAGHIWVVVLLGLSNTEWFYRRQGHTTFEALCWLLQWWKADYRSHNLEVMENFFLFELT